LASNGSRSSPTAGRRVVVFGSYAPSLFNFRGPLIAEMVRRGHEVFALAPEIDEDSARKVRSLGATPIEVPLGRTSLNPFAGAVTLREVRAAFRRLKPDVVIAYTIKPILIGGAACKAEKVRTFVPLVTGLGYAFTGGREAKRRVSRFLGTTLYRRAFRTSKLAIFQNPDDLADFRRLRLLPPRLPTGLVNGSGVDMERFARVPLPEGPSFLMIARFLKDKGIREFGAAAARLKREFPAVRISLVGWIDTSPDSIGQADLDRLIADGIEYLGEQKDVRPAIAAHSVYVLPSYREGTPRSVLEAMSMGRPVITSDAPGCRQTVVEGENGFLVPVKDADALYRAMRRFVEEPALIAPMGEAAHRIVADRFDVHKVNETLLGHIGL
jgi:glycosyltransferase involved in cell wall biosynthesis